MKYHKIVTRILDRCEDCNSWDIEANYELRSEWTEEYVVRNANQIYKDLLNMEAALDAATRQYEGLKDLADLYAERLRRAQQ